MPAEGVTEAVYVQANWAPARAMDEVRFVVESARRAAFPIAIVAYAEVLAEDIRPQLDALTAEPSVRGIRMQLHWHEKPLYRFAPVPDLASNPVLQRNVARLADYGLSFDLQVFAGQMAGRRQSWPWLTQKVTFVLQHAGMFEDLTPEGIASWRAGMKRLAACSDVVSELSGLGTFLRRNDPAHVAFIASETLALFGAERCLFGSNFPIEKLWTTYASLVGAHRAGVPATDHDQVFNKTTRRVYRLGQYQSGRATWLWKSRCSTTAISSLNRASSCWGAIAAAPAVCRLMVF